METTQAIRGVSVVINRGIFLTLIFFQSGCAIHFTDKDGIDHHIGFVSIKAEKNNCVVITTVKSVGLSLDFTSESGGLNIGLRSNSKSYIKNDEYVELEDELGSLEVKKITSQCSGRVKIKRVRVIDY